MSEVSGYVADLLPNAYIYLGNRVPLVKPAVNSISI